MGAIFGPKGFKLRADIIERLESLDEVPFTNQDQYNKEVLSISEDIKQLMLTEVVKDE